MPFCFLLCLSAYVAFYLYICYVNLFMSVSSHPAYICLYNLFMSSAKLLVIYVPSLSHVYNVGLNVFHSFHLMFELWLLVGHIHIWAHAHFAGVHSGDLFLRGPPLLVICCVFRPAYGYSAHRSLVEIDFLMLKQLFLSLTEQIKMLVDPLLKHDFCVILNT